MVLDEPDIVDSCWNVSYRIHSPQSLVDWCTGLRFSLWFLPLQIACSFNVSRCFTSRLYYDAQASASTDYIARAISDYLTSETGVTIIFECAIVPKWRESRLSFKNVSVSRRLSDGTVKKLQRREENEHLTAVGYDVCNHPGYHHFGDEGEDIVPVVMDEEDSNMSLFDLTIDSVDVTLSLRRWLDGKGLVEDAVVRGVRGVLGLYRLQSSVLICSCLFRQTKRLLGPGQSTKSCIVSTQICCG